jgi:sulfur relay (sulfurtransferase) complex TusBCD TusD component (DsrE family)
MTENGNERDIGFVISKAPLESGLVSNALTIALNAQKQGKTIGLFLISDGVWLGKRNQKNHFIGTFEELLKGGAQVLASEEHLLAAGIATDDVIDGIVVTKRTYKDLVSNVMENWTKVVSI